MVNVLFFSNLHVHSRECPYKSEKNAWLPGYSQLQTTVTIKKMPSHGFEPIPANQIGQKSELRAKLLSPVTPQVSCWVSATSMLANWPGPLGRRSCPDVMGIALCHRQFKLACELRLEVIIPVTT